MTRYRVVREAKINTGNYENTLARVEIEEDAIDTMTAEDEQRHLTSLFERADNALRAKIDAIELKELKSKSKASRFGV